MNATVFTPQAVRCASCNLTLGVAHNETELATLGFHVDAPKAVFCDHACAKHYQESTGRKLFRRVWQLAVL